MRVVNGPWIGRTVGAMLIAEGLLVAIIRLVTIVYVLASEAYSADRFGTPLPRFLPWLSISIAVCTTLVWAGSLLRREPEGAWGRVGVGARVVLVAAWILNAVALVRAVLGLAASPATVEGWVTWTAIGTVTTLAIVGLARDALPGNRVS